LVEAPVPRTADDFSLLVLGLAPGQRSMVTARINVFPTLVLVQPNGIRIPGDEFVDGQTINGRRTRNPFLLAVDKDRHEIRLSLTPRPSFGRDKFALSRAILDGAFLCL
jgi:hypothetical protein